MHQLLLQYVWHLANDRLSEAKFHFVDFFFSLKVRVKTGLEMCPQKDNTIRQTQC